MRSRRMLNHHTLCPALRFICKRTSKTDFSGPHFSTFAPALPPSQNPFLPVQDSRSKRNEIAHLLQSCIPNKSHLPRMHGHIVTAGFRSDTFLNNILLSLYSKCHCIHDARRLFDQMPHRNLISWSSIVSAYTQHGQGKEALVLFSVFRISSLEKPNEFIFASVLRACTKARTTSCGTQVHDLIVKSGFDSDVYVGTALIDFYSKNGDMDEARLVFDKIPVRNAVTWTAIITGYSQAGRSDISLQLFAQLRTTTVCPDRYVLSSVISACSVLGFLEGGRQIHGHVLRNGTQTDVSVNNVLIDFYSKCHRVRIARRIFNHMVDKNVVSWTTMIAGYMQNACDGGAMDLFSEMSQLGWHPDGFTCTSILTSCGSTSALRQGKQVHSYTIKANLASDDFVKNGLIDMYAKCDSLSDARNAFDDVVEPNVVSYNAMIEGYARDGDLLEALNLFRRMRCRFLTPNLLTFVSLLGASAMSSAVDLSKQIHGLTVKYGVSLDIFTGSALIDVYSKCSFVDDARVVFEEMDEKDIVVWNAMIFCYTLNGQCEDALKLFLDLQLAKMKLNEFTFVALVASASNLASLFHGLQFHNQITKTGLDFDPYVSNALIDMYAKCGSIEEARKLFDTSKGRDVVCWNSMISRYAQHGHAEEALVLFERMQDEGMEPTYVTYVGVLSACSHVGLLEKGLSYFDSMRYDHGIEPGMEHYACVVALLGRSGKLQEAREFIERMPIEPAAVVWRSLLSACQIAGNVNMGRYAAESAISIDPKDSGSYVLLSNIFASKGMWSDVEMVRRSMNCNSVAKEPGHSWIEVRDEIHDFVVRDRTHSQADLIYEALDRLTEQIRGVGYVVDVIALLMED